MTNTGIFEKIKSIQTPTQCYLMFNDTTDGCFFGKDSEDNIVFMIASKSPNVSAVNQKTQSLHFEFNKKCVFQCEDQMTKNTMHVLTCKAKDEEKEKAFIRLTRAFATTDAGSDLYYYAKLFSSISMLFDKQREISEAEAQGLFTELYTIFYLHNAGIDISDYWQSRNKMKFDFSFGPSKRLEIKSTLKPERIHHFRHEQLISELYDIYIVSYLLRKNDGGLSLFDVVEQIRSLFPDNYSLMLHIDSTISHISNSILYELKYDIPYLENNLRFYNAKDIPHINEKTPEGVFNVEYDCSFINCPSIDVSELAKWLKDE